MSKATTLIYLNRHTLAEILDYMDERGYAPITRIGVLTSKAFELEQQLAEAQGELAIEDERLDHAIGKLAELVKYTDSRLKDITNKKL